MIVNSKIYNCIRVYHVVYLPSLNERRTANYFRNFNYIHKLLAIYKTKYAWHFYFFKHVDITIHVARSINYLISIRTKPKLQKPNKIILRITLYFRIQFSISWKKVVNDRKSNRTFSFEAFQKHDSPAELAFDKSRFRQKSCRQYLSMWYSIEIISRILKMQHANPESKFLMHILICLWYVYYI